MAHNEIEVDATPEAVFAVLSDPSSYADWVVGASEVHGADPGWPAPGTAFDHRVGVGPLTLADHSEVEECKPPRLLRLLVKARPLSQAHVVLRLEPRGARGARVAMDEFAADARSRVLFNRLTDPLLHLRNAESLKRLKALAERREADARGTRPVMRTPAR